MVEKGIGRQTILDTVPISHPMDDHGMYPKYIIKGARVLYFLTLFLLTLSIFRLVLHIVFRISTIPASGLYWGIIGIWVLLLWILKKVTVGVAVAGLGGIVFILLFSIPQHDIDLLLVGYQSVCEWCTLYTKSTVLAQIFLSMGLINFSFSYVVSTRDKQFYGVPLGSVIQEQFPEHGYMFVFYACLILVGLYSCGMDFHIIALVCLCGAILALLYTCLMAVLYTFSHQFKQEMVEYYLYSPTHEHQSDRQKAKSGTNLNRILVASDYINAYYKANGSVPRTVTSNLWKRLLNYKKELSAVFVPDDIGKINNQRERDCSDLIDEALYTRLITYTAAAWQHMLHELSNEQQSELICMVLQVSLHGEDTLLKSCEAFLCAPGQQTMETIPMRAALPLCGLVSYLRGRETASIGGIKQYWDGCQKCLQTAFQIDLFYSRTAVQFGYDQVTDTIPRILFLILETTLLIELSSLTKKYFSENEDFWDQLEEVERSFQVKAKNCSWFSDWGIGIVSSYKIDWFRYHHGMLSAHLTYQRLFGLIQ